MRKTTAVIVFSLLVASCGGQRGEHAGDQKDTLASYSALSEAYNRDIAAADLTTLDSLESAVNDYHRHLLKTPRDISPKQSMQLHKNVDVMQVNVSQKKMWIKRRLAHEEGVALMKVQEQKRKEARERLAKQNAEQIERNRQLQKQWALEAERRKQRRLDLEASKTAEDLAVRQETEATYAKYAQTNTLSGLAEGGMNAFLVDLYKGNDLDAYKGRLFLDAKGRHKNLKAFTRGSGVTIYMHRQNYLTVAVISDNQVPDGAGLASSPLIYVGLYQYESLTGIRLVPAFKPAQEP